MSIIFENRTESGSGTSRGEDALKLSPILGRTVFEALATGDCLDIPEDISTEFKMSLTRHPGGSTVPDE